ncbi:energy transducer TonB [Sorangium sp. So ce388]|uniref:energy transducer TonB n=1 Tax=Sorangium sp. So ce388 TaxID=3133309 RepID=UPI003F5AE44F
MTRHTRASMTLLLLSSLLPAGACSGASPPELMSTGEHGAWACSFPEEAKDIKSAVTVISVYIGADGSPLSVRVLSDPGHGFGQAAARCAMTKRFRPAQDEHGTPIVAWSPPITIHYTR